MLAAIVNSLSRHQIDASEDDTVSTATRDRGTGTAVPLSDSTLPLSTDCRSNVGRPNAAASRFDTRTRLAASTARSCDAPPPRDAERAGDVRAGLGRAYRDVFCRQARDRCAGRRSLVFPVLMLMQMMSAGAMGGGSLPPSRAPSEPAAALRLMRSYSMR